MPFITNATNKFGDHNYIVDPVLGRGSHQTFTAAIAAALAAFPSGNVNIMIRPGTYTENFTLPANFNLIADVGDAPTKHVVLQGTVTMTGTGQYGITGIYFKTNGATSISTTGTNSVAINFNNCFFESTANYSITNTNVNASYNLDSCYANITTTTNTAGFLSSTGGSININNGKFSNSGLNTVGGVLISGGQIKLYNTESYFVYVLTGTSVANFVNSSFDTSFTSTGCVTNNSTGVCFFSGCKFTEVNIPCITLGTGAILGLVNSFVNCNYIYPINQTGAASLFIDAVGCSPLTGVFNVSSITPYKINYARFGQITFDGTNYLSNYATGSFTPTAVGLTTPGTGTYALRGGLYTRVGNLVRAKVSLQWGAHTGTGILGITGLPFTSANHAGFIEYSSGYFYNGATSYDILYQVQANQTTVYGVIPGAGAVNYLSCTANQNHQFQIWYSV